LEVKLLRIAGFIKASKYQNEGLRQTKTYMITPIYCCYEEDTLSHLNSIPHFINHQLFIPELQQSQSHLISTLQRLSCTYVY